MYEYIFCFLAEAVAGKESGYRLGARHALMVWITAPDENIARSRSVDAIESRGWLLAEIMQGQQISDPDLVDDDILRSAAEDALANGHALVVYKDEIVADA